MDAVTLPLVVANDRPCVDLITADAGGSPRTLRALVDTGGGALLLRRSLADGLGLGLGFSVESDGGEATSVEPPALAGDGFGLDTDGIAAYAIDDDAQTGTESERIDVVLPASLLRRHGVVIDYPRGELRLSAPDDLPGTGVAVPVDVERESGFARAEVEVAGEVLGLLLDTGTSCCLVADHVFRSWEASNPVWPRSAASVGPANMSGLSFEASTPMLRVPEVSWGAFTVPGVAVAWRPDSAYGRLVPGVTAPVVGSLGGNLLRHFRVELAVASGLVRLEQGRPFAEPDADMVGMVVGIDADGHHHVIGTITGLDDVRVGDRLLAVDGEPVAGLTLGQVIDALRGTPAETVHHLALDRDGELVEAEGPVLRVL
ncbi:MAG TPA: PDZ domain-containing protein [Acidimicrobiales bacterium]|nr:PDZ domain-containing protein [Acidimicrobiales bacterium]